MFDLREKFSALFDELGLGVVVAVKEISGGLMHKMYKVTTKNQEYALKVLNPNIVKRDGVLSELKKSESFAKEMSKKGIPVISSLVFSGKSVVDFQDEHFLIFLWKNGVSFDKIKIEEDDIVFVAVSLKKLHNINTATIKKQKSVKPVCESWSKYLHDEDLSLVANVSKKANESIKYMPEIEILSHKDLDPKNWLKANDGNYIIDWESYGYINPTLELLDAALYWSGYDDKINLDYFASFIKAYGIAFQNMWEGCLYTVCINRLDWLEYNLKRVAQVEICEGEELEIAKKEVEKSITSIKNYVLIIERLEKIIKDNCLSCC